MIPRLDAGKPSTAPPPPGGVYLCQVNERVSCGACCGLYNVADPSRPNMTRLLKRRSEAFRPLPRTVAAIDDFAREIESSESRIRPFPRFHHCPFIGLIGSERSRVGCLLHPSAEGNAGVDYRGLSYYGAMACRTFFCPAPHALPTRHKQVLRLIADDWHLYGLVVTEAQLLAGLFGWIEARLDGELTPERVTQRPAAAVGLRQLLALKTEWPFRPAAQDTPCHYFFTDRPHVRPGIDYRRLGVAPSRLDPMLRELGCELTTADDLRRAERLLESSLETAVRELGTH